MKGEIIQQKYQIIEILGQDSFTETFLARGIGLHCFKRYAIKKFRPILGNPHAKKVRHIFDREANILKLLSGNNPHIPKLYDSFTDGEDLYLVREWIEGLTLEQKVQQQGKLAEAEVIKILRGILSALQYIHDCNLICGKLSPSSIVLRQKSWRDRVGTENCLPVIIYFNSVIELKPEIQKTNQRNLVFANQKEYISSEEKSKSTYTNDFYSLGSIAIYLLTGKTPAEFKVSPYTNQLLWHQECDRVSSNLVRVINRAICPQISDRFTSSQEMLNALFSRSITISESLITQSRSKPQLAPEFKIIIALSSLGLGLMVAAFAILNFDWEFLSVEETTINSVEKEQNRSLPSDSSTIPEDGISTQALLNIPVFRVGTSQEDLIDSLGKPTDESRGYWGESRAFLYKDFIPQKVDLGYLSDTKTQQVLQTEVSFFESVTKAEVQKVLQQLLMEDYSAEIEQKIDRIVERESNMQEFSTNDLKGIIQRNSQNKVYVAVWDADFH